MSEMSYEQALARLKTVVEQLERGSLDLEESLRLFEEGMNLSRRCDEKLREVEERVKVLVEREDGDARRLERGDLNLEFVTREQLEEN
ncbi:MAG: exodeoxyribonuclease VII small subunit [Armatimonadetes bacterium]|nr:exodeoxyribonuclease VII small subunit [Armatimonadota bacterium]